MFYVIVTQIYIYIQKMIVWLSTKLEEKDAQSIEIENGKGKEFVYLFLFDTLLCLLHYQIPKKKK